jgi:transposase
VQDFLSSVIGIPVSQGAIQKILDRVGRGIASHYEAIGEAVRNAPVNHIDETTWKRNKTLEWLWLMCNSATAFFMLHSNRSKVAFQALIKDWQGILVSDGYAVYQQWAHGRQTCLAHLIREARGLAERSDSALSRPGAWALKELRLLCRMAKYPPSVGQWNMFYARLLRLIGLYRDQQDEAGKFVRRIEREMDSLWLFLQENNVAPTNNHAERTLRFAVLWRKRSFGTRCEKGDRFAERILSLRQTCRLQGKRTFTVLVEAMQAFMQGRQPELEWIYKEKSTAP